MNKKELILLIYGILIISLFFAALFFFAAKPVVVYFSINGRAHPDLYMYKTLGDYPLVCFIFALLTTPIVIANWKYRKILKEESI